MVNNDKIFDTLVIDVHFLGIENVQIIDIDLTTNNKVLLYFCCEEDSVERPLSISEGQAKQLYNDLKDLFTEYTT
jgi:hypothetical protein